MSEFTNQDQAMRLRSGQSRSQIGIGRPLGEKEAGRLSSVEVAFPTFERGIDLRDAEQDQPDGVTQESNDFEVTERNRIRRAAGHAIVETMVGRVVKAMMVHTSLDFSVELLMFDEEYIGVKGLGDTDWYDADLPSGDEWVGIPNLDNFLFTNGTTGIHKRAFGGAGVVDLIADSPPAVTLANFAGRVFVGGATIGGDYQALSVGWSSDAEGLDWTGNYGGFQLLIANGNTDDRVIAMRSSSFDLLTVLCQKSVWIGRQTGDRFEPAIFEPRVLGRGCIAESTVIVASIGVIYLGESGVYVFDGNQDTMISGPINDELLPLSTNTLKAYSATYEQVTARYWLFTPTKTWVYEVRYNRWLRWRFVANRAVAYSEQFTGVTWDNMLATWDAIEGSWDDLAAPIGQERVVMSKGADLAVPSRDAPTYIDGSTVQAEYGFLRRDTPTVNNLFETQRLNLRRLGGPAEVQIWLPDNNGVFTQVVSKNLPSAPADDSVSMGLRYTGRGTGAQLKWLDSSLEISKAEIYGLMRGRKRGII